MLAWGQRVSLLAAWVMGMVAGPTAAQEAESVAVPAAAAVPAAVPVPVCRAGKGKGTFSVGASGRVY